MSRHNHQTAKMDITSAQLLKLIGDTTLLMATPTNVTDLRGNAASSFWNKMNVPISPDSDPIARALLWKSVCALSASVLRLYGYYPNFVPAIPPNRINVLLGELASSYGLDLYLYRPQERWDSRQTWWLGSILSIKRGFWSRIVLLDWTQPLYLVFG